MILSTHYCDDDTCKFCENGVCKKVQVSHESKQLDGKIYVICLDYKDKREENNET